MDAMRRGRGQNRGSAKPKDSVETWSSFVEQRLEDNVSRPSSPSAEKKHSSNDTSFSQARSCSVERDSESDQARFPSLVNVLHRRTASKRCALIFRVQGLFCHNYANLHKRCDAAELGRSVGKTRALAYFASS